VLLRHLVMPGLLDETRAILTWIAREVGPDTYVNLMDQYRPAGKVGCSRFTELFRRPLRAEIAAAYAIAAEAGLRRFDERSRRLP
jgi:putative pyruvate formate lyase activating enzyme